MGTTGLIYVAIVAAWAAYLVPMLLRRNDEEGRRRSAQKYSSPTARVLSRQSGAVHRARYVVRPRSSRADVPVEEGHSAESPSAGIPGAGTSDAPRRSASHRAARMAAMRRRRVLSILMLSLLSVTALVSFAMLPWWSLTVPVVLIVAFVAAVRVQLRRAARIRAEVHAARVARAEAYHDHGPATAPVEPAAEAKPPVVPEPMVEPAAVTPDPAAEGLWDPVPVTLPTYVMKEKAPERTVRTINLSGPEVFSSARSVEPEPPVVPVVPESEEAAPRPGDIEIRRAVGD